MSHIERRKLPSGKVSYRVRYIDPDGRERSRSFGKKADAETFETGVRHTIAAGSYVDPRAGRQTVRDYLEAWRAQQGHLRPSTASDYRTKFGTMVYPHLGNLPIAQVKPSTVRAWQKHLLDAGYAPSTITVIRGVVAGAFADAVLDRILAASPFDGVKTLEVHRAKIVPLAIDQVHRLEAEIRARNPRYAALIPTAAGTGLRPSELWGLTVDRVDFLRRQVRVDRQLRGRRGPVPVFGPPKTRAGDRTVPLPDTVIDALAAHLAAHPARPAELIFRTSRGTPLTRSVFARVWTPGARAVGIPKGDGLHQLRHFYASLLIADGRSVKEVQERLGHASAQETLDTYSHLFPDSDDGTRAAIDRALGARDDESGATGKDDAASE